MLAKILIILTITSLLVLNLFSLKESNSQSRSKYMDMGAAYLKQANNCKSEEWKTSLAVSALACYTAAIAEK